MQEKILNISREKAATREALTKSQIEEFSIILPPLPLQQSFAARIAAIESQREQLAASIRELETLLACRMETLLNCPQA
ncbi:type I restriction-modification enzyme, S subunit [gut metagenome]|uniref:Type I restriction-modification enzyme, S subunit n=1 Tax=gut metagenome TaxID=749906 RepID=J9GE40_9ZZZZ